MQIICKVGDRRTPDHPLYEYDWRDGRIMALSHGGSYPTYDMMQYKKYVHINIPFDPVTYYGTEDYRNLPDFQTNWLKLQTQSFRGKYPWEVAFNEEAWAEADLTEKRKGDFFVDFRWLRDNGYITQADYESIYDPDRMHNLIVLDSLPLGMLKREGVDTRLPRDLTPTPNWTTGDVTVAASGGDYTTWAAAINALGATLTGNCTIEGSNAEQITESALATIDHDSTSSNYSLTLFSDQAHGGLASAGHRIYSSSPSNYFHINQASGGILSDITIKDLVFTGYQRYGIAYAQAASRSPSSHSLLVERCVMAGVGAGNKNLVNRYGIYLSTYGCAYDNVIRNCIIYDIGGDGGYGHGISLFGEYANSGESWTVNNTVFDCVYGILEGSSTPVATMKVYDNICYGNTTDFSDANSGLTTARNVTQDSTSPDSGYASWNPSPDPFTNYSGHDVTLDSTDTTLDDGASHSSESSPFDFSDDIEKQTRSTWYIGASEYVAGGGRTTKNTDPWKLGQRHGQSFRMVM